MTFRPRRDVSQTTVYAASGRELVAINTSLHLVFNNVAHPHFPWCRFRARLTAAVGRKGKCQFSASTTQSDDEPIMCDIIRYVWDDTTTTRALEVASATIRSRRVEALA